MSLRYRLFLWVSGLFLVAATGALFMESYVTNKELNKAQEELREKILNAGEKRRGDLQNFLASAISQKLVMVDAILNNASAFTPQIERFGPTLENEQHGTWGHCVDTLMNFKWIDFLQNTNDGKVAAAIVPKGSALDATYQVPIDDNLCWVYRQHDSSPLLGIHMPFEFVGTQSLQSSESVIQTVEGIIPSVFFLFDPQKMAAISDAQLETVRKMSSGSSSLSIPVTWTEGYALLIVPFLKSFENAVQLLRSNQLAFPLLSKEEITQQIETNSPGILNIVPSGTLLSSGSTEKYMQSLLEGTALRFYQINMIWMLINAYDTGIFGDDLFQFPSPDGITFFSASDQVGLGIERDEVLFSQALFDDSLYFKTHPPTGARSSLGSSLAVIPDPQNGQVYLGNTSQLGVKVGGDIRYGYLTIGVNADGILKQLVLALHQNAFLVTGGKIYSAFDPSGAKLMPSTGESLPLAQMLEEKSGIVPWSGENYSYLHMKPFGSIDLHFFLMNPEATEFALLRDLEEGSEQVITTIIWNIHAIGLLGLAFAIVLLHNISRKITGPIVQLARATKEVVQGRYDEAKTHLPPVKYNDEIAVLCHSFEEMVKGLEEKEKVKGVLNKVVSPEIAEEILQGNVHLGGEEKKVSVLFADIRGFTKMTQHMRPQEVIDLLNVCMTKISAIIDKNEGVIDKYVGDEAMALFGAPIMREDSACKAVRSAVEMIEALKKWNRERAVNSQPPIEMGVAVHTGVMLAGNMGAENRLNYTVLGNNVNLAARLCDAAQKMEVLITKATLDEPYVREHFLYEAVEPMHFKGIDAPVEVYRVKEKVPHV